MSQYQIERSPRIVQSRAAESGPGLENRSNSAELS